MCEHIYSLFRCLLSIQMTIFPCTCHISFPLAHISCHVKINHARVVHLVNFYYTL